MTLKTNKGWRVRLAAGVALLLAAGLFWYVLDDTPAPAADEAAVPQRQAVLIRVERAASGDVSATREYIGTVESIQSVKLRPEVTARITQVNFREGAIVKAGDVLFTLDDSTYAATVALRQAELSKAVADHDRAQKYYNRLKAADTRSVSASDLDTAESDMKQAAAVVEQSRASLKLAQIDLDRTRITAPISGRIGRAYYTQGNYVSPSIDALAEIVQITPVRVNFSLPDRDFFEELSTFQTTSGDVYRTSLTLPDGQEYREQGSRDFEDNIMDSSSGTIVLRLRFENKDRVLIPGSIVRVELTPIREQTGVLVAQTAIQIDSEGSYLYIVDQTAGTVSKRRVEAGSEVGDKRAVTGVQAGELVATQGVQNLSDGAPVRIAADTPVANAGSSDEAKGAN